MFIVNCALDFETDEGEYEDTHVSAFKWSDVVTFHIGTTLTMKELARIPADEYFPESYIVNSRQFANIYLHVASSIDSAITYNEEIVSRNQRRWYVYYGLERAKALGVENQFDRDYEHFSPETAFRAHLSRKQKTNFFTFEFFKN